MDKFVIEIFIDGELLIDEMVETDQRLLNEQDLDAMTANRQGALKRLLFVRPNTDVNSGYFIEKDGRPGLWDERKRVKHYKETVMINKNIKNMKHYLII